MSRFWTASTATLKPYVPGEQPANRELIKLNTNEHCLAPSKAALAALAEVNADHLRRYPDPNATSLCEAIARQEQLPASRVFVGNGSDEVLATAFMAFLAGPHVVTIPDITYSFYPVWAQLYGVTLTTSALDSEFSLDIDAFAAASGPLLFANPNAPTGRAIDRQALTRLLAANRDRLVVVDEAYFGFGAESAAPLIDEYDNLLITRTLSKSHALAGLRVGYALGHEDLIEGLRRVKDSFNSYPLDAVAQRVATVAIDDREWFIQSGEAVAQYREALSEGLAALGFEVIPSQANFVFAQHTDRSGRELFDALRAQHILVRRWDKPGIDNWLRITVGTPVENSALLRALSTMLEN